MNRRLPTRQNIWPSPEDISKRLKNPRFPWRY